MLLLLLGCLDYGVNGKDDDAPAGDSPVDDSPVGESTPPDSDSGTILTDSATEPPCQLETVAAGEATGTQTCRIDDFSVGTTLVVEAALAFGSNGIKGPPVVAPTEADGQPKVLFGVTRIADAAQAVGAWPVVADATYWTVADGTALYAQAVSRPASGGAARSAIAPDATLVATCFDYGTGLATTITTSQFTRTTGTRDIDHDGLPEFFYGGLFLDRDCNVVAEVSESPNASVGEVYLDDPAALGGLAFDAAGAWDGLGGGVAWQGLNQDGENEQQFVQAVPVRAGSRVQAIVSSMYRYSVSDLATGEPVWSFPSDSGPIQHARNLAVGDATGDGSPDICVSMAGYLALVDLDGDEVWRARRTDENWSYTGGCAMADLDGDRVYEVIDWSMEGLRIHDGRTGAELASLTDIGVRYLLDPPLIADIDLDGQAEIVMAGNPIEEIEGAYPDPNTLYVVGPGDGHWTRTRPVWNQVGYDVVSIRDDGREVVFPRRNPDTYNSYRAQPAHDGPYPDLVPVLVGWCADGCTDEPGSSVWVSVRAENLGAVEAPAGATLRLLTFTPELGLVERATTTLEAIAPGMGTASVTFQVPVEDWGDRQVLEVIGDFSTECDMVNDRLDLLLDVCGP